MLDTVDHRWPLRAFCNVNDALEPQEIGATMFGKCFEKERENDSRDGVRTHDCIGLDLGIMVHRPVDMVRQPGINVERLGTRIIEAGIKEPLRLDPAMVGVQYRRTGIEFGEATEQRGLGSSRKIDFCEHDPVGDSDLLL